MYKNGCLFAPSECIASRTDGEVDPDSNSAASLDHFCSKLRNLVLETCKVPGIFFRAEWRREQVVELPGLHYCSKGVRHARRQRHSWKPSPWVVALTCRLT